MHKKLILAILVFVSMLAFFGCSHKELTYEKTAKHDNVVEDSSYGNINMTFKKLDGEDIRAFETKPGRNYEFEYSYSITDGDIKIMFTDSKGDILAQTKWSSEAEKKLKAEKGESAKLNGSGGILEVESSDNKIRIVISGRSSSGEVKIEW